MDFGRYWVEKVVPPILIGAVLWEFVGLRVRRQNEPQGAGRGYYLETNYFGNRSIYEIPFYIKDYRIYWRSNVDKFPLAKLPSVAFRHILQFMNPTEQIKLAIASQKMEQRIQWEQLKTQECFVCCEGEKSLVAFPTSNIFCGPENYEEKNEDGSTKEKAIQSDLLPWENPKLSTLSNIALVLQRIQILYSDFKFGFYFNPSNMESFNLDLVLSAQKLETADNIKIAGGTINSDDLDTIMKIWSPEKNLCVSSKIPANYRHKKAFKFRNIVYDDAHWITLKHLSTLKNSTHVKIGVNHGLTCIDLNRFLIGWTRCNRDMFRTLSFAKRNWVLTVQQERQLFRDLVVVEAYRGKGHYSLIICNPSTSRTHTILAVNITKSEIRFSTYAPDEIIPKLNTTWAREFEVLKLQNEKKKLLKELTMRQLNEDSGEAEQEEAARKIVEIRERIQEVEKVVKTRIKFFSYGKAIM